MIHDDGPDADGQSDEHGHGEGDDQDDVAGHVAVGAPHLDSVGGSHRSHLLDRVRGRGDAVPVQKGLAVLPVLGIAPVTPPAVARPAEVDKNEKIVIPPFGNANLIPSYSKGNTLVKKFTGQIFF